MGHEWHHQPPIGVDDKDHEWSRPYGGNTSAVGLGSVCAMCGTERMRWVLRSGEVVPARYRHPEGYARHGDDRLTAGEWRQTHVATLFPDFLVKPKAPRKLATAS